MSATQVDKQFWTIERAVAFVVAPIVTPLSGALALWLGNNFPGVHVSGSSVAAFATGTAVAVGGGFIKWLDGRQKFVAQVGATEAAVLSQVKKVEAVLPESEREKLLDNVGQIVRSEVGRLQGFIAGSAKPVRVGSLLPPVTSDPDQPADDSSLDAGNWPVAAGVSAS